MMTDEGKARPQGSVGDRVHGFLQSIRHTGPWTLTSIHDGSLRSQTFDWRTVIQLRQWVNSRENQVNLYWSINPTYGDPGNKAALEDISALERLHVDIDPDDAAAMSLDDQRGAILALLSNEDRLKAIGLPGLPSLVLDSGGGYWAFWNLIEPYSLDGADAQERRDNAHRAGGHNKWIANTINAELGLRVADDCHNLDRIARLPFTTNIATAKKRAKGRSNVVAGVQFADVERRYTLDQFGWADVGEAGPCRAAVEAVEVAQEGWQPLPDGDAWTAVQVLMERYPLVRPKTMELILLGERLHNDGLDAIGHKSADGKITLDRSIAFHVCNMALQRAGVPLGLVISILKDRRFAISEHGRFPANKAGKVSKREVSGGELTRFVTAQVKKAAAKLRKERFDAEQAAREAREAAAALDGASSNGAQTGGAGGGQEPPPPPPGGDEPPMDEDGLPENMRFVRGNVTAANPAGSILKNEYNILVALRRLGIGLSYNSFADQLLIDGLPGFGPYLEDKAVVSLWLTIDRLFGFLPKKDYFFDVVRNEALRHTFHPVVDYIDDLPEWDGIPRVDDWLTRFGGADDTPYTRAVGKLMLVAAVRRLREPGAKFDEMTVIEGPQGTNKSTALKVLAVNEDWFLDDLQLGAKGKEMLEQTLGKWIIELADMHKRKAADVNAIKAQLSRTEDRGRLSYDKMTSSIKRRFVFFGTTNEEKYLDDPTGNRRFWPVMTREFNIARLTEDRDQLWAEAAMMEARGDSIRMDKKLWSTAAEEQAKRSTIHEDPWLEHLQLYLGEHPGKIHNSDVWKLLGLQVDKMRSFEARRVSAIMQQLGFEREKLRFVVNGMRGKKAIGYVRGAGGDREVQLEVRVFDNGAPPRVVLMNSPEAEPGQEDQASFYDGNEAVPF